MIQQKSMSGDDNIYAVLPGVEHSGEELTAATGGMQSSFNELSTQVSVSAKCKQMKANT